ncbi:hypothetical protein ACIGHB_32230 [Streptomyces sp. NPDC085460]|uniref:hypothetical protein n=1 Tax=Streptomyces sp. NPDC085460 TaxID=3365723 RepID=UPI0037CE24A1
MTPTLRARERIELVTLLLAGESGITPTAVEAGPTGTTVTHKFLATGQGDRQWFVKTYAPGTNAWTAETAIRLSEYARLCRVPVPAALPTVDANRFVATGRGLLPSVTRFVPDAVTADRPPATEFGRWAHAAARSKPRRSCVRTRSDARPASRRPPNTPACPHRPLFPFRRPDPVRCRHAAIR